MRNIPVFTTEFGVASLILKEIPYTQTAYVRVQSSLSPCELLEECAGFCRAAGAEKVFASGADVPDSYLLHTKILRMEVCRAALPSTEATACPVTEENADNWRKLYNQAMANVDNASYMDDLDVKQMLQKGDGYFVHRGQQLLGIGRASGQTLDFLAAFQPGAGEDVVCALAHALTGDDAVLTVASTNEKAINLYQRLGFVKNQELSRWYVVAESEKK